MKLIHFEKKLGLGGAIAVTVGAVIGVGIFVIVGEIGSLAGSWAPLSFAAAGFTAIFGTLVAIALGSTIPADGGGYYYTKSLFGKKWGAAASWLIIVGALGSLGTVSLGVADYIRYYVPGLSSWLRPVIAIGLILGTWLVNTLGIMASEKFQIAMVVQLASAMVILVAVSLIGGATPDFSQPLPHGVGPFLEASAMAVLAYTGFNIIGELGDEVSNPRRNIPLTIIFGLGIIIFIYVGVGWIVAGSLTVEEMKTSKVALLDTAIKHLGRHRWFVHYLNLAAVFAAVTSINAVFLAVPREFSAQAEDGLLPKWIMKFNPARQTFPLGMAVVAGAGCLLAATNLSVGIYGLMCVFGLILANVFFSIGVLRLFRLFPEQIKNAPFPIKKWWVYPSGLISAFLSLGFSSLALFFLVAELRKL